MATHSRTQTGSVTLGVGVTSTTATPLSYTAASSIVKISVSHGTDRPNSSWVKVAKTNSTTLTFTRAGSVDEVLVNWELHEFSSGVIVEDLSLPIALPTTYTISSRDLTKTFVIDTAHGAGNDFTESDACIVRLNSATELEVVTSGFVHAAREIQVIEYDGCTVQTLTPSLTSTTLILTTATILNAVDITKTIVFGTMTNDSSTALSFAAGLWRAVLTNTTTVTLERYTGTSITVAWHLFVVEFTDDTVIQAGQLALSAAETDTTVAIVDTSKTATFLGSTVCQFSTGRTDWTTDDCRIACVRTSMFDSSTVRFNRELTSGETSIFWQIVVWGTSVNISPSSGSLTLTSTAPDVSARALIATPEHKWTPTFLDRVWNVEWDDR